MANVLPPTVSCSYSSWAKQPLCLLKIKLNCLFFKGGVIFFKMWFKVANLFLYNTYV